MENLITKTNELFGEVRFVTIDEKQYAVANDVAKSLGYSDCPKAVRTHCKGVAKTSIPTKGGIQEVKIIPEGDIYRLIIKSRLPEAEKFESWVMDEVLPELRQSGVVILENATKEAVDFKFKYGTYRIRKTFTNSNNPRSDYEEFKELAQQEWKSKRLNNADRVKLCKLIQKGITDKVTNNFSNMRPSELLSLQELITDIQVDVTKLENKKNGGKLASATRKINQLEKALN